MKCPHSFIISSDDHIIRRPFLNTKEWLKSNVEYGIVVPCGKCIVCRHNRSAEWSVRLSHELQSWKEASFITLSYNEEEIKKSVPWGCNTLDKEDLRNFMKRFRKKISPKKIKYFAVGEYGTKTERPHYHAIIFGWTSERKDLEKIGEYYKDNKLGKIWKKGNVVVGAVEPNSIYYVTGYLLKDNYITEMELRAKEEQFMVCSKGIGEKYLNKNSEAIKELEPTMNGYRYAVPRYYIKKIKDKGEEINKEKIKEQGKEIERTIRRKNRIKNKNKGKKDEKETIKERIQMERDLKNMIEQREKVLIRKQETIQRIKI